MKRIPLFFALVSILFFCATCKQDVQVPMYQTRHVVIVVVDGARWSETWGFEENTYIPHRYIDMRPQGSVVMNFRNNGFTYTNAGHTAITTGVHQPISNNGLQYPDHPSIFQYWRRAFNKPQTKAWVITSKDKLHILADTYDTTWAGQFTPMYDCGVNGPATGYREDSVTYNHAMSVFQTYHPDLVLINFKEPDASGHTGNWQNYLNGVISTDQYVFDLWNYLQNDPYYAGTTTLFVTNDHGRHLPNVADGFWGHGDACEGCRHIELLAIGPDIRQNYTTDAHYDLPDIAKTTSVLLGFPMPTGTGKIMHKILR